MKTTLVVGLTALLIAALTVTPLFTMWSLNLIFDMGIEWSWQVHLALLWLSGLVYGASSRRGSK